ncbi:MAG TPA: aminopeptidase P family N-terminal domain-containing protein, partial [Anaerolineae bacterium]|nr:aminopeptidase P family N-terminal domain-containing protein [Anaerolineae bacterium]
MDNDRLSRLTERASAHGLDVVALVPGPNLFYLTGLSFHLSERPIVALFPVDGQPA